MDEKRRKDLKSMIARYTAAHTVSRDAAFAALAASGIYTPDGEIAENYGGKPVAKPARTKR